MIGHLPCVDSYCLKFGRLYKHWLSKDKIVYMFLSNRRKWLGLNLSFDLVFTK